MQPFADIIQLLEYSNQFYIIVANMEGKYSYINTHYKNVFLPVHGEILNKPVPITMHPDDVQICEEVSAKCFQNPGKAFPAIIRKHDGKGGFIITQWEFFAMFDDDNNPAGIFCLGNDITQYSLQQEELARTRNLNTQHELNIRNMVYIQSHLIRSPLANIMGLIYLLDASKLDNEVAVIFEMILKSAVQLDSEIKKLVSQAFG